MAASLPTIDFEFDKLRDRMAAFTARFDDFIERGRRRTLDEKNTFAKTMAEDKDHQRSLRTDLEYYKSKEATINAQSEKEAAEVADAESAIADMERKRRLKDEHKENLQAQIEETRLAIEKKRAIRTSERQALALQQSRNVPELAFWEDHLGMRIDGAGVADHLKITFTHLVERDCAREFWVVIGMMSKDYEIVKCRPKLDPEELAAVVDRLNETRRFATFLKEVRVLFKRVAVGE